jgi:[ribosomal protein S5]-alanine N-acetyltransferase
MSEFSFLPFPILESKNLILRQITNDDVAEVFALRSNPETMKYIPRPLLQNHDEALAHIKVIQDRIENNEGIDWAITQKGNPKLLGIIGHYRIKWEHFRSEIGYMLLPEHHGQGIVPEAIQLIVDFGFNQMNLHSIEALIDPENQASAKVLERNGFVKEAHFKENEFYNGQFIDTIIYSLLQK